MQINKKHRELIESVIRENTKFKGNEELLNLFIEAIYKKSYLIMDAIKDMSRLRRHLLIICDSCMEQVLKEKQKFDEIKIYKQIEKKQRLEESIVSVKKDIVKEENVDEAVELERAKKNIINLKEEIQRSEKYDSVDSLIDPLEFCPQKRISEHTLAKLINIVKDIDEKNPQKNYFEIFSLRYIKKFNQGEIAKELKISQIELSKRFVELVKLTREYI